MRDRESTMQDRYTHVEQALMEIGDILDDFKTLTADVDASSDQDSMRYVRVLEARNDILRIKYEDARRREVYEWRRMDVERMRDVDEIIEKQTEQFADMIGLLGTIASNTGMGER